jgi:molybdopterin-guanine dinucleotide biosynthesis protein A
MGCEKPLVQVGGQSLIERVVDAISPVVDRVVVVTNRPELYDGLGLPTLADSYVGRGPLAGIHAALKHLACDAALIVACDYPFLDAAALGRIARTDPARGVVVPEIGGRLHPVCALYAVETLPAIEASLASGELMVLSLVSRVPRTVLREADLGGQTAERTFFNVNTPDDLRRAEEILEAS